MEETAMMRHINWLKEVMVVTPMMEDILLHEEKLQILKAYDAGLNSEQQHSVDYYRETYNTYEQY